MADEEKDIEGVEDVPTPGKKGVPILVIIIAVALVSMGVGFVLSNILGGSGGEPVVETGAASEPESASDGQQGEQGQETATEIGSVGDTSGTDARPVDGEETDPGKDGSQPVPGVLVMDPFTVNLNDPFGRRYAEIHLKMKIRSKDAQNRIQGNELIMSEVRDEIFMIISSKSYKELKNTSGKITLKEEIKMRVNEIVNEAFGIEPVMKIFFQKFLIQ